MRDRYWHLPQTKVFLENCYNLTVTLFLSGFVSVIFFIFIIVVVNFTLRFAVCLLVDNLRRRFSSGDGLAGRLDCRRWGSLLLGRHSRKILDFFDVLIHQLVSSHVFLIGRSWSIHSEKK